MSPKTRRAKSTTRLAACALLAVLMGSACTSEEPTFDAAILQAELRAALQPTYDLAGLTLFGVDCPSLTAQAQAGDVFACTADVERQFVRLRVQMQDLLGGYDWTTLDVVLVMDDTETLVAAQMSTQLGDTITLQCGSPNVRALPVGSSFLCDATDSGRNSINALLTVNGPGQTGWELVR
jgi:hypothetical protein